MNRQIMQTLNDAEGRYLTEAEMGVMRDYAQTLDARLDAAREIEAREPVIIEKLMEEMAAAYPDFTRHYGRGLEAGARDTGLVLRYCAQAVVRDDVEWLDRALFTWLNTILEGVGLTDGFVRDTYVMMERICRAELKPETFERVQPCVQRAQVSLSIRDHVA